MTPRTLSAGGLELPLILTADGPRLAGEGDVAGLADLVNGFLNGLLPELRERLHAGDHDGRSGVYAIEPPAGIDREEAAARWHRLTGTGLGDDPIMAGSSVSGAFVLPRSALLEILDGMLDLRATQHEHSPITDPAEAPPDAESAPVDEAQRILALAVAQRPGAPGRADELRRLERRARELEAMADPAEAAARRRVLLIELDTMRVLSGSDEVGRELRELDLDLLAAYHAAARRLLDYLTSDERRAALPESRPGPVLGAAVSVDWFRHAPSEDFQRTALGEWLLAAASPGDTVQGRFYTQLSGTWYEVVWRRDDGETPALLELGAP